MSRLRKISKKLLISLGSLIVAFLVTECVLRAMEPGPFSFVDRNPYVDSEVDSFVRHKPGFEGRWDSTWYAIDSRGFRGPERQPTFAEGELRIACVGDSCTFGKGVLESETWPRLIETKLRADGRDALVFNLGINGASGRNYREVLSEHASDLQPQVVAVGYNLNDFPNAIRAVDEEVYRGRKARRIIPQGVRDAMGRLATYRKLRQVYYDTKKAEDWAIAEKTAKVAAAAPVDSEVWAKQRGYLEDVRRQAAEHGGHVVVFLFPYESQVYLDAYDTSPIDRLRDLCGELGLPFVDLAEEFRAVARATDPPQQLFIPGDRYHPNGAGYAIVAERLISVLENQGWL